MVLAVGEAVADVQLAVGREALVHTHVELVAQDGGVFGHRVVTGAVGQVRQRQHVDQLARRRVDAAGRHLVVRERRPDEAGAIGIGLRRQGVVQGNQRTGGGAVIAEVAGALRCGRHRLPVVLAAPLRGRFPAAKKEHPVAADRSAERPAELVSVQLLGFRWRGKRVAGVEGVVAQEFETDAVEGVGPGLDGRVDDGARSLAVLGREVVGLDAELGQRVDRRLRDHVRAVLLIDDAGVVVDPVQHEAVEHRPRAIGDEGAARAGAVTTRRLEHARRQAGELQEVPAVERQVADRLAGHDLPYRRGLGCEHGAAGHENLLGDIASLELEVHPDFLVGLKHQAFANHRAEARQVATHRVRARGQKRDVVLPRGVGHRNTRVIGADVDDADGDAWHHSLGGVGHGAVDLRGLGVCKGRAKQERCSRRERTEQGHGRHGILPGWVERCAAP